VASLACPPQDGSLAPKVNVYLRTGGQTFCYKNFIRHKNLNLLSHHPVLIARTHCILG
jgi:hypothetical protein